MESMYINGVGLNWEDWGERRIRLQVGGQQVYLTQAEFLTLARMFRELEAEAKRS